MYTEVLVTLTGYSKSISVLVHNRPYHLSLITDSFTGNKVYVFSIIF
jgi:hypothetical protein